MVTYSLSEFTAFVNQQLEQIEAVNEYLSKATALIQVASQRSLSDFPEKVIDSYLWVLSDILENAHQRSNKAVDIFLTICRIANHPGSVHACHDENHEPILHEL